MRKNSKEKKIKDVARVRRALQEKGLTIALSATLLHESGWWEDQYHCFREIQAAAANRLSADKTKRLADLLESV